MSVLTMGLCRVFSSRLALWNRVFRVGIRKVHKKSAIPMGRLPASSAGRSSRETEAMSSGEGTNSYISEHWVALWTGFVRDEGSRCRIEVDVNLQRKIKDCSAGARKMKP